MKIEKRIEPVVTTTQVHTGFTLTLSMEEAAIVSAMAGDATTAGVRQYALETGRLTRKEAEGASFSTLLHALSKIVPAK